MRGSGVRILFAAPIKIRKIKDIRDVSVLARDFAVATFVPAQCVGRDCESSLRHYKKISKGKYMRDVSVLGRGFAVATFSGFALTIRVIIEDRSPSIPKPVKSLARPRAAILRPSSSLS
jgi:hypothetical protein